MAKPKNINLLLMDGEASGRIKCTLSNWTGVAYKIPRIYLDRCAEREDLNQSGVYLLFGTSDETGENVVYVGQAGIRKNGEGILNRLQEHQRNPEKDYWTEAVVFTTSNNSFGPTEISYLENKFETMAVEANRYVVKNSNEPNPGNITEEKECEMEEFIEYAKLIMGTLGHKVFEPYAKPLQTSQAAENKDEAEVLSCSSKTASARGQLTSDGFVVFTGSTINPNLSKSCPAYVQKLRDQYAAKLDGNNKTMEDLLFSSPSAASSFVLGYSSNGNTSWTNKDGKMLKELD